MRDGYDTPLTTYITKVQAEVAKETDDQVLKAVWKLGINVDKDKLVQALTADKERYNEAYRKGYSDAKAHGYWILWGYNNENMQCSVCGASWGSVNREADFCPNCGCMMDLKYGGSDNGRQ